jgi:hypothetical protein
MDAPSDLAIEDAPMATSTTMPSSSARINEDAPMADSTAMPVTTSSPAAATEDAPTVATATLPPLTPEIEDVQMADNTREDMYEDGEIPEPEELTHDPIPFEDGELDQPMEGGPCNDDRQDVDDGEGGAPSHPAPGTRGLERSYPSRKAKRKPQKHNPAPAGRERRKDKGPIVIDLTNEMAEFPAVIDLSGDVRAAVFPCTHTI